MDLRAEEETKTLPPLLARLVTYVHAHVFCWYAMQSPSGLAIWIAKPLSNHCQHQLHMSGWCSDWWPSNHFDIRFEFSMEKRTLSRLLPGQTGGLRACEGAAKRRERSKIEQMFWTFETSLSNSATSRPDLTPVVPCEGDCLATPTLKRFLSLAPLSGAGLNVTCFTDDGQSCVAVNGVHVQGKTREKAYERWLLTYKSGESTGVPEVASPPPPPPPKPNTTTDAYQSHTLLLL